MKKKLFNSSAMIIAGLLVIGTICGFKELQPKPWKVPDAAKNKKNTIASDATSIASGKALWTTHCKSCHGSKGLGDGSKAAQLKTEPGDFSISEVQSQTDGELFYKITQGRDDMPSFKKKIPEADDIWAIVNYMRTLKK